MKSNNWTDDEVKILIDHPDTPVPELQSLYFKNRSLMSIYSKRNFLRERGELISSQPHPTKRKWSEEDTKYLMKTMDDPIDEVAEKLGRTHASVQQARIRLVRSGKAEFGKRYNPSMTKKQIAYIRQHPEMSGSKIAQKLGLSQSAVYKRRRKIAEEQEKKKKS